MTADKFDLETEFGLGLIILINQTIMLVGKI